MEILLVEDNEGDYILVSEYLRISLPNASLSRKSTLEGALTSLSSNVFDIVLLDLSLPDSNGADSIRDVIKLSQATPIIVLTGNSDKQFGIDSLKLGVEDYLVKDEVTPAILNKSISYSIERRKNQLELAKNERRFRALIENFSDGLCVIAPSGETLEMSPVGKQILGLSDADSFSFISKEFIHPEDVTVVQHAFENVIKNAGHINFCEFRIKLPGGSFRWIENTFNNLIAEPSVKAIIATFKDVTERKSVQELIRESEEKYRFLFNRNPQLIFIWDVETAEFIDVNDSCTTLYGYSRSEFKKMKFTDVRICTIPNEFETFADKVYRREIESYFHSCEHKKKSGEIIYVDNYFQRIILDGKITVLTIGFDVTEKRMLANQLEEEKIKKQQEITSAVIAAQEKERQEVGSELHDNVNQILASSRLYLGLARKNLKTDATVFLNQTEELISSAITELRNLSHSLIPPSLDETELIDAIDQLVTSLSSTTEMEIESNSDDFNESNIPEKMKLAIYRIIQEQFNNIIKYAKASKVVLSLTNDDNNTISLSLKDNGVGFDVSKKSKGVGLTNMRVRASLFKGEVVMISSPNNGCELQASFRY